MRVVSYVRRGAPPHHLRVTEKRWIEIEGVGYVIGGHGQGHLLAVATHLQDSVEFYRKAFLAIELLSDKILTV